MKKRTNDKWDEYTKLACITFTVAILIFLSIFLIDASNLPTKLGIVDSSNSKEWLNFCINYFGAIAASFIGFIGAIMAVNITLEKQNEFRQEDSRKNALPLIKVKTDTSALKSKSTLSPIIELARENKITIFIALSFKNVGQREMYNIWIGGVKQSNWKSEKYCQIAPILYKGDTYSDIISSSVPGQDDIKTINILFKIYYKDCYDNWYYQKISGFGKKGSINSYRINELETKSAPMLIDDYKLPGIIKNSINQSRNKL